MIAPRSLRAARLALIALGALVVVSCTLLGTRELKQCSSDDDCRGNADRRNTCVDNLCAATTIAADATPEQDAEAGPPDAEATCSKNSDCPEDPPQICVNRACTPLLDAEKVCPVVLPRDSAHRNVYREDGVLLIGVHLAAPNDTVALAAVQLAIDQINNKSLVKPRLAAVVCDKGRSLSSKNASAAVAHLAKLGVPLFVGELETSELLQLATSPIKGMAIWSTRGNHDSLQEVVDGGAAPADGRVPFRFLVDELPRTSGAYQAAFDEALRRANVPTPKVVMVHTTDLEVAALATQVEANLGATLAGVDYQKLSPQKPAFERPDKVEPALVLAQKPHVILALGGDEMVDLIYEAELNWGTVGGQQRPIWIVTSRAKFNPITLDKAAPQGPPDLLRKRLIAVDVSGDPANLAAFRAEVVSLAAGRKNARNFNHLYDAMYAVAFAATRARFRSPTAALTGADLTRGLDEVLQPAGGGAEVVGAVQFPGAIEAVKQDGRVHFTGTTGEWVFDGTRRTRRMGTSYYCFPPAISGELNLYMDAGALSDPTLCAQP